MNAFPSGSPPRLGVLVAHFDDSLQRALWGAIRTEAGRRGVSTVALLGHGLDQPDPTEATANVAYRMVGPGLLDGLIVFANTLGTFSGPAAVGALVDQMGLPAVSLGVPLAGRPTVRVPGGPALAELVRHLVRDHGLRKFALMTGPADHYESQEREAAVRAALEAEGCPLEPGRVVDGAFLRDRGREAAGVLLASGPPPQAIVCLSDQMAVGTCEALEAHGLRVPDDVVVTGFDDLEESRWRRPALTTVGQPLEAMAAWAVDQLLGLMEGRPGTSADRPARLVIRRSCGCRPEGADWEEAGALRSQVEQALVQSEQLTRIRQFGARLLGSFRLEPLARQWEETTAALGLEEAALILFEGAAAPLGREAPARSRHVRWTARGGLETQSFPTSDLFPPAVVPAGRADWFVIPLTYQEEPLGYLLLRSGREHSHVYETLRDQVSSAVKATLLMEASRSHENLLEREVQEISHRTMQAIGQDIHDDLCQYLAGISMLVSVLAERTPEDRRGPVTEIGELLDGAQIRARQYARTLYPPGLEEHGLGPAVEDLVESLQATSPGIRISLEADQDLGLADHRRELQVYRIVQESLGNALRHSGTDLVMVRLRRKEGFLEAEVRDFGRGLPAPAPGRGMGLKILRYRAASLGAVLTFHSLDPGLAVACRIPLEETSHG